MLRLMPLLGLLLLLTACGPKTITFTLTTDLTDAEERTAVFHAAQRVVFRRTGRLTETPEQPSLTAQEDGTVLLTATLPTQEADILAQEVLESFSLNIMLQSMDDTGDLYVEEQGWFTKTDITEKDILWTQSFTETDGKGVVVLLLTDEGRTRFDALIRQNIGRTIGLFVRGKLMSKMQIARTMENDKIAISGIPSPDIAGIFADDVNVGLHVTFSQL